METKGVYNFKEVENKWKGFWDENKVYRFDPKIKGKVYSVDTPPPTVSGKMHIGHAFSYSQQDFIIRYHRMKGESIFYPFGTDDNGLPTERLVEKTKGIKASSMKRDEFVKLCMDLLKKQFQPEYLRDWRAIGISCDWDILYSTIDDNCRRISQWSFLDLFKKNRVYRKDAPSMWCAQCETGISQVECEDKNVDSMFNTIIFKVDGNNLEIDTTRPELLAACVAIFYNPEDKRYKQYKGKMARVPLFDFEVPIMEDSRADPEKGTGIVMCCTFGDSTDMEWQKAYNLQIKEAVTKNGKLSSIAGKYEGLNLKEARKIIINDLKENGLLLKQRPIKHDVKVHERCGTEIEYVKSVQWFVRYLDLKDEMIKWGESLNWHPEFMVHRYVNWVKGLQWDWLISRQRFFGIPFPVWYCNNCGEVVVAEEKQLPVDPLKDKPLKKCKCGSNDFSPEKDILDTWFTSSMTPRLAIELMDKKTQERLYPMSLRPQASEIITFWLFNTVVKSNLHFGKNPFEHVAVSGFVTLGGQKMSKSRGNVVEPQVVLEKYGADALRYWAASSKLGEDIEYQEKELVSGQRTVTKLWNAAKFTFMNLNDFNGKKPKKFEAIDLWLLNKLNEVVKECTTNFENYEYSKAKNAIEKFFWQTFCDNYLEIVKHRIYGVESQGTVARASAQYVLHKALLTIIKLFAPIMPFITEELYETYYKKDEGKVTIHLSEWPEVEDLKIDDKIITAGDKMVEVVGYVRKEKSRLGKSLKEKIKLLSCDADLKVFETDLIAVTQAERIEYGKELKLEF